MQVNRLEKSDFFFFSEVSAVFHWLHVRELNYMGVAFKGRRVRSSHCFNASQMSNEKKKAGCFGYVVDYNYYPVKGGL